MSKQDKEMLLTLEFPPDIGGISTYLSELFRNFPAGRLVIMAPKSGNAEYPHEVLRVPFYFKRIWPKWSLVFFHALLASKRMRVKRIYISHVLPMGYVAYLLKKILGVTYVVFLHGMDVRLGSGGKWKRFWLKRILRGAEAVVANSVYTKDEILRAISPMRRAILVVQPSLKTIKLSVAQRGEPVILSVARLVPRKGIDLAIAAFPKILAEIPDVKYYIIGDGPERERLRLQIESLGLKGSVSMLGSVPDATLAEFYSRASVFLFPVREIGSDVEGFGISPLEASAHGIPVIAGRSGGVSEAVAHGETGILIPPGNAEAIYETTVFLLKNKELARKMGEAGKLRAEKFKPELQTEKLLNYLEYGKDIGRHPGL